MSRKKRHESEKKINNGFAANRRSRGRRVTKSDSCEVLRALGSHAATIFALNRSAGIDQRRIATPFTLPALAIACR
jgi:hypothetical protein